MGKVLGISGRDRHAAAAVSVDGRVVSAVSEESFARVAGIGYGARGGFPHAAAEACLESAGIQPEEVEQIVVVDDGPARPAPALDARLRGVPMREMAAARADALHAAMASDRAGVVLVCGSEPAEMAVFHRNDSGLGSRIDIPGADGLIRVARGLASTLGLAGDDPFAGLDRLSLGADPAFLDELAHGLSWNDSTGIHVDQNAVTNAISRASGEHKSSLADDASPNVRLRDLRRQLAASFTCQTARIVGSVATHATRNHGNAPIAAGGSLFANARFNTELGRVLQNDLIVARVPEALGRAVGAAAVNLEKNAPFDVAIGPAFTDEEIKRVLDNCRLDYVYEPDWGRLLARVSRMLAQGKVVGWFQGAMAFGPRAMGTRSILCDPSGRYARQNVNEYLRQVPIDEPLPVAFAASVAGSTLAGRTSIDRGVIDAEVAPEWRSVLTGALDWRGRVRVHGSADSLEPRLGELLELHYAATRTPGLIETNLAGPGEPVACSPRDAVRATYSSAIDALVIGRFLLMKDYWLLRTQD